MKNFNLSVIDHAIPDNNFDMQFDTRKGALMELAKLYGDEIVESHFDEFASFSLVVFEVSPNSDHFITAQIQDRR